MKIESEQQLLKLIKYTPLILILLITTILTLISYFNQKAILENEKQSMKNEFRLRNKEEIKQRVYDVYEHIENTLNNTEEELKDSLEDQVERAYSIVLNIYYENRTKSEKEIIKLVNAALRPIRFNNGRGYFFIYDMNGVNILNAGFPNLEGKSLWNYKDARGVYLLKEMKKILSTKSETFYEWYWLKPKGTPEDEVKKIGFFKKFGPLNWFIGTGEYVEDFRMDIKDDILEYVRGILYGRSNYVFLFDYKGNALVHLNKKYEGHNYMDYRDNPKVVEIGKSIIELGKKGEGFLEYDGIFNPIKDSIALKTVFIKGMKDLQWVIGTGFYEDELNKKFKDSEERFEERFEEYLLHTLSIVAILIFIFLIVSKYLAKVLEQKFIQYRDEIDRYIDENTKQQNILAYQSRLAGMGEMIGNIAHQWRQPLSNISTAVTGMKLKKEIGVLDNKEFNESVDYITNAVFYLSHTIDDFRSFFKPNKKVVTCEYNVLVKKVLTLVSAQFSAHDIEIIHTKKDIKFSSIENELIQVVLNIMSNAKDELIKIENEQNEKLIFIDIETVNEKVAIKIKDNAGGIPEKIIHKIFEPYFSTKTDDTGTGIGLYMSKEIVTKHLNGSLSVENQDYEYKKKKYFGAEFIIELPI